MMWPRGSRRELRAICWAVERNVMGEASCGGGEPILRSKASSGVAEDLAMSPEALNSLFSLCIGFALAGALASGYQAMVQRPAGFGLLQAGVAPMTFAAVPFFVMTLRAAGVLA